MVMHIASRFAIMLTRPAASKRPRVSTCERQNSATANIASSVVANAAAFPLAHEPRASDGAPPHQHPLRATSFEHASMQTHALHPTLSTPPSIPTGRAAGRARHQSEPSKRAGSAEHLRAQRGRGSSNVWWQASAHVCNSGSTTRVRA